MRSGACMLVAGVTLAGCSPAPMTITVGAQSFTVRDQGYYRTTGVDFCMAGAPVQMKLDFVDYAFICDGTTPPQRDGAVAHLELTIVLAMNDFMMRDPRKPFVVGKADCTNGPTAEAIATLLHYAPNAKQPDPNPPEADSGTVQLTQYPSDPAKPWVGTMDLGFGGQRVKQAFSMYACN
jgi:hypothetical protein